MQCFWACLGGSFVDRSGFCLRSAGCVGFLIYGLLWRALAYVEAPIMKGQLLGSFTRNLWFSIRGLLGPIDSVAYSFNSLRVDITAWKNLCSKSRRN